MTPETANPAALTTPTTDGAPLASDSSSEPWSPSTATLSFALTFIPAPAPPAGTVSSVLMDVRFGVRLATYVDPIGAGEPGSAPGSDCPVIQTLFPESTPTPPT